MKSTKSPGPAFFAGNRERLKKNVAGKGPIVITGNSYIQKSADNPYPFAQDNNFWYLSGLLEPGLTLVIEDNREYLILPKSDPVRDKFDGAIDIPSLSKISGVKLVFSNEKGWKQLEAQLKKIKRTAIIKPSPRYIEQLAMYTNPARASLAERIAEVNGSIDLVDIRSIIGEMRSIKQDIEIRLIKNAINHTRDLYQLIEQKRTSAEFESDLMAELSSEVVKRGIGFAYDPIIASGKNALTLHYTNNNSKIDRKNFLLLDLGAKVKNYNADITRTVANRPTKRHNQVYDAVLAAHNFAISLLKPGVSLEIYEKKVNRFMGEKLRELGLIKVINKKNVREFYPHATSHFLGLDVHDVGDHKLPLSEGVVITVEPGIYIKNEGIGIRLEDVVLITKNGRKILSESIPKVIDRLA